MVAAPRSPLRFLRGGRERPMAIGPRVDGSDVRFPPIPCRSSTIGDWKKLAEAGDFDSNYLHLNDSEVALQSALGIRRAD